MMKPLLHPCKNAVSANGIRKRKRVTWPSDDKICQVRLYYNLSDTVSIEQRVVYKSSQDLSSSGNLQNLPPDSRVLAAKRVRLHEQPILSMSAERPWHCPPKILLERAWLVAEGDESMESSLQPVRERKELEAIYPHLSSIPYSPIEPQENFHSVDGAVILQIPIIAMEDVDECDGSIQLEGSSLRECGATDCPQQGDKEIIAEQNLAADVGNQSTEPLIDESYHRLNITRSAADPEIAAAAAAACMAVKALGGSSLVDEELLVRMLKNPALLKSLIAGEKLARESVLGLLNNFTRNQTICDPQKVAPSTSLAGVGEITKEKRSVTPPMLMGEPVDSSSHIVNKTGALLYEAHARIPNFACTQSLLTAKSQGQPAVTISKAETYVNSSNRPVSDRVLASNLTEVNVSSCLPAIPSTSLAGVGEIAKEKMSVTPPMFMGEPVGSSSHMVNKTGALLHPAHAHIRNVECTQLLVTEKSQGQPAVTISKGETYVNSSNRPVSDRVCTSNLREANVSSCLPAVILQEGHASNLSSLSIQNPLRYPQVGARGLALSHPGSKNFNSSLNAPSLLDSEGFLTARVGSLAEMCRDGSQMKRHAVSTPYCQQKLPLEHEISNYCLYKPYYQNGGAESGDSCNKSRKHCVCFNSCKGCHKGVNCDFMHQFMKSEMENHYPYS